MIKSIRVELRIGCDSCMRSTAKIKAWIDRSDLKSILKGDSRLSRKDLPDLWEYHTSGGWGMTNYTKTQLLCPTCVRVWREESVLDQMARKVSEKDKK